MFKRVLKVLLCVVIALAVCSPVFAADSKKAAGSKKTATKKAESWKPVKPISMVVMASPGGSTDLLARAVEKVWMKHCTQPLQVVNKPGGGGVTGAVFVANSEPDGYTLLMGYGSGHDIVMPHLQKVEYKFTDLEPVARMSVHSVLVAVPEKSEFKSVKDIVDWAKKENKPVTAAVSTTAGAVDLVMRGIGKSTGINVTPVPHAGGSQAITTLIGGHTIMGGGHPAEVLSQLKAGRIRALAIATPKRDPSLPDVPTLKEQGINFYTWGSVKGVAVPKKTPKKIIDYYANVLKKISEDPEFKKTMQDMLQPVLYQGPEEFKKFMQQAHDDYGKLIEQLDIVKEIQKEKTAKEAKEKETKK